MSDFLGTYHRALPKFRWGVDYANTLEVGVPLRDVKAYSTPAPGTAVDQNRDGSVSAWTLGHDQLLEAKVVGIPNVDEPAMFDPTVTRTGWEGDTGWGAFLEWAQARKPIFFFPDRTPTIAGLSYVYTDVMDVYITAPWQERPAAGWLFHKDLTLTMRSAFRTFMTETIATGDLVLGSSLTAAKPFVGY